ncbi:MAG: response regulator [Planctomycetes bacterium]|nr:response regulator [Planctomycetota bacterium]
MTSPGPEAIVDGADVLVVDDDRANTMLLHDLLEVLGYLPRVAHSGQEALEAAHARTPDLVLLDVMMPGMDGFQVCRKLRAEEATRLVPIVLVTALHETQDRIQGIEAGADDFLSKPFNRHELSARVRSLLRIRSLHARLERSLAAERRLSELKEHLVHLVVHDLRNPLTGVMGNLDLLFLQKVQVSDKHLGFLKEARRGAVDLLGMINSLLDVTKMEEGELELHRESTDLGALAKEAAADFAAAAERDGKSLVVEAAVDLPAVQGDRHLLRRVFQNLVSNALKYVERGGHVRVDVARAGPAQATEPTPAAAGGAAPAAGIECRVEDDGEGIPESYHAKIFEKFGQVSARADRKRSGTGLGLPFCKLAVEAHGGRIRVESEPGKGSRFVLWLPG